MQCRRPGHVEHGRLRLEAQVDRAAQRPRCWRWARRSCGAMQVRSSHWPVLRAPWVRAALTRATQRRLRYRPPLPWLARTAASWLSLAQWTTLRTVPPRWPSAGAWQRCNRSLARDVRCPPSSWRSPRLSLCMASPRFLFWAASLFSEIALGAASRVARSASGAPPRPGSVGGARPLPLFWRWRNELISSLALGFGPACGLPRTVWNASGPHDCDFYKE